MARHGQVWPGVAKLINHAKETRAHMRARMGMRMHRYASLCIAGHDVSKPQQTIANRAYPCVAMPRMTMDDRGSTRPHTTTSIHFSLTAIDGH